MSAELPAESLDDRSTAKLLDVVEFGTARSWRFLESTGVLEHLLPDVAAALRRRARDSFSLDPLESHQLAALERRRRLDPLDPLARELDLLPDPDQLLLALFLVEVFDDERDPVRSSRSTLFRLDVADADRASVLALVDDRGLLWSAAHQPGALTEVPVLQLAAHLGTAEQARMLYIISALRADGRERWELQRLRALHELVQAVLDDAEGSATSLAEGRRAEAAALLDGHLGAQARLAAAPPSYVLRTSPDLLARHARLLDPAPGGPAVTIESSGEGRWSVEVVGRDQPALLAAITGVLGQHGLSVTEAVLATWDDGVVLDAFLVDAPGAPDRPRLEADLRRAVHEPVVAEPLLGATMTFHGEASPWHTICEVVAPDGPGVLHAIATAFAGAGVAVRSAQVSSHEGSAIDRFEVTDQDGGKLDLDAQERARQLLASGTSARRRRLRKGLVVRPLAGAGR